MRLGLVFGANLVAGLAAGCGGGSRGGYPTAGGTNTTATNTPTPGNVVIADYSFTPDTVTVKVGALVTWTNDGSYAHTVTADSGGFDSGQLDAASGGGGGYGGGGTTAGSYSTMFGTAGTYPYHCANHPTLMKGVVIVTP